MATDLAAEAVPCTDPECGGQAEPEQDGDHAYYECLRCGYSFGFTRTETLALNPDGACSVGIPENLRRAASQPMTNALARSQPPLLSIGRRDGLHPQKRDRDPGPQA